jgi:hypothetical protein
MTQLPEQFELTAEDLMSGTWRRLQKHLNERLAMLRMRNDSEMSDHETAKVRGQIAEIKALLALGREK